MFLETFLYLCSTQGSSVRKQIIFTLETSLHEFFGRVSLRVY